MPSFAYPMDSPSNAQILDGLDDDEIAGALTAVGIEVDDELEDDALVKLALRRLKKRGGLHAQFVDALPEGRQPELAAAVLAQIVEVVQHRTEGLIQL